MPVTFLGFVSTRFFSAYSNKSLKMSLTGFNHRSINENTSALFLNLRVIPDLVKTSEI
ncbi:unnamed protein product [Larinioides sclopetarius]|uniref:Uncharacterized protein n=1 Tax=Larinioides sclopetarius TaxID=280406 RepID=A0AAV2A730_9ARAC